MGLWVCFPHEGPQKSMMSLFTRSLWRDFVDSKFKTSPNAFISTIFFSSVGDVCTFGMSIFNIKDSEYGGMMFVNICDGFLCFYRTSYLITQMFSWWKSVGNGPWIVPSQDPWLWAETDSHSEGFHSEGDAETGDENGRRNTRSPEFPNQNQV